MHFILIHHKTIKLTLI